MNIHEIGLALSVFSAAAVLGSPIAAAITAAFVIGLLLGRNTPAPQ